LNRFGFLNDKVIAAHMVWPTAEELALLKKLAWVWSTIRNRT
jgi:cytosine/adenosine deaminase-related metal-dependent hydrolase